MHGLSTATSSKAPVKVAGMILGDDLQNVRLCVMQSTLSCICGRRFDIASEHSFYSSEVLLAHVMLVQAASTRLSHAEKEDTLKQLVSEGWLAKTPERAGCYSIGVRTFLELGQYLTDLDLPESTRNIWQKFL
ncbi:hypothetical protein ABBQ32_010831 [Trebouxia sp. C0010 RCD-2024]